MRTLTIDRRFNGPPDSGNGGYVCGAFAVATGADLRVRLVAPPPLEVPLAVQNDESGDWTLACAAGTVARGTPARLRLDVPAPPQYVQAVWASQHYAGFVSTLFPTASSAGRTGGAAMA